MLEYGKYYDSFTDVSMKLADVENQWLIIVFKEESWPNSNTRFTLEQRSYLVNTNEGKWFKSAMLGNSLWGSCVDGTDRNVRLDWYLGDWKVEYCYLITEEEANEIKSKWNEE